jgi:hypothetical protein
MADLAAKPTAVQKALSTVKRDLVSGDDTKPAEAALAELGKFLGLEAKPGGFAKRGPSPHRSFCGAASVRLSSSRMGGSAESAFPFGAYD